MATKYGVNATYFLNSVPVVKVPVGEGGGRVQASYDSFAQPAVALVTLDVISFCAPLPPNARLLDLGFIFPAWGNSATFDMGYLANDIDVAAPTAIVSALSVTSAGKWNLRIDGPTAAAMNFKFNKSSTGPQTVTQLQGRVQTVGTGTTGTNYWQVYYIVD